MQGLLGSKVPKSFEDYKDIRYNGGENYYNLKTAVKDKKLQLKLTSGEYNLQINGQQNKHILGHHDYIQDRSYLLEHINPQELVNKYAGTGEILRDRNGNWKRNQEKVSITDFVGVNTNTNQLEFTRTFKIIYSKKKGTHVVPVFDEGE